MVMATGQYMEVGSINSLENYFVISSQHWTNASSIASLINVTSGVTSPELHQDKHGITSHICIWHKNEKGL